MQQYRVAPHEGRSPKIMNCNVEEDIFIEMVRRERPLWDKKNRDYKNLDVKNRIWKSIAVKCETTGKKNSPAKKWCACIFLLIFSTHTSLSLGWRFLSLVFFFVFFFFVFSLVFLHPCRTIFFGDVVDETYK